MVVHKTDILDCGTGRFDYLVLGDGALAEKDIPREFKLSYREYMTLAYLGVILGGVVKMISGHL